MHAGGAGGRGWLTHGGLPDQPEPQGGGLREEELQGLQGLLIKS